MIAKVTKKRERTNLFFDISASKECTTVIIAHHLSTIHNANRIYVLEYGKVVESGTHDDLIKRDGAYAAMYALSQKEPSPVLEGKA